MFYELNFSQYPDANLANGGPEVPVTQLSFQRASSGAEIEVSNLTTTPIQFLLPLRISDSSLGRSDLVPQCVFWNTTQKVCAQQCSQPHLRCRPPTQPWAHMWWCPLASIHPTTGACHPVNESAAPSAPPVPPSSSPSQNFSTAGCSALPAPHPPDFVPQWVFPVTPEMREMAPSAVGALNGSAFPFSWTLTTTKNMTCQPMLLDCRAGTQPAVSAEQLRVQHLQ